MDKEERVCAEVNKGILQDINNQLEDRGCVFKIYGSTYVLSRPDKEIFIENDKIIMTIKLGPRIENRLLASLADPECIKKTIRKINGT